MSAPTRPHRFPPLAQLRAQTQPEAASAQLSYAEGFQAGQQTGHQEGFASGHAEGLSSGHREGLVLGAHDGAAQARQTALTRFETLAQPLEALFGELQQLRDDYQTALRKEVVELVAKVARQVIRCELALQPVQLLSLVDETLATMPPTPRDAEVYLNPEDLQRIQELAPERAARWRLLADAALEPGECRVKAGAREADAGCRQRLAACMEQVASQLNSPAAAEVPSTPAPAPRKRTVRKPARSEEPTT